MTTKTITINSAAQENVLAFIDTLSAGSMEKLASYAAFLRHEEELEAKEDAEDIADAEACKDEPSIPFEVILAKHEAKYGPLD
jgi:hypothetical protein